MTKMGYAEQLKHPNWQRRRLERLNAAGFECENCGDKETTLHVHHRQYFKDRLAWEYADEELIVLCEPCHEQEHIEIDVLKQLLACVRPDSAAAVIAGFHKCDGWLDSGLIESARQSEPLAFAAGFVARIAYGLCDISEMRKVAEYAASLHNENAESRLEFNHSRGNTFGED